MIDYKAADFWLRFAQVVGYVLLGVWVYFSNRQKATVSEIKSLQTTVETIKQAQALSCGQHIARTVALETSIKTVPSHTDLSAIHQKIGNVKGTVDRMDGTLTSINKQMQMLYEHHLKGDRS